MTKHPKTDDLPIKNPSTADDTDLQAILQELEIEKAPTHPTGGDNQTSTQTSNSQTSELAVIKLQAQLTEREAIAKKAQIDYLNLKADFDFLMRQTKIKEETSEQETLLKVVKKFLPFVEDLRKSLLHLTDAQKAEPLGKGVQMVYDKFLWALHELSIFPIDTLYIEPDALLHEPVSIQPTPEKKLKGKIIQMFEQGFYYKKEEEITVILPSKVVVGG